MRALVLLAVLVGTALPISASAGVSLQEGSTVKLSTQFDGLTARIAADGNLREVAAALDANPGSRVRVEVFVDPTDPNPMGLSQARANAIKARLIALGAPRRAIQTKAYGGAKSLVPSVVEAMKAKNRRAHARVLAPSKPVAKKPPRRSPPRASKTEPEPQRRHEPPPPPPQASERVVAARPAATPEAASTPAVAVRAPPAASAPVSPADPRAATPEAPRVTLHLVYGRGAGAGEPAQAALQRAGAELLNVARVRESHAYTVLYVTPRARARAHALVAESGIASGARLVEVDAILPEADAMLVLSSH